MPVSSSVGFFTIVQNDVRFCFLLRGKWHEVPIGDKKVRHIERQRNIPPNHRPTRCHCEARSAAAIPLKKYGEYTP